MPFLDKNGLEHLTRRIIQAENIKTTSTRGHTVGKVIENIGRECNNTQEPQKMILTNEAKEFKIGEDQNGIDVSGDVEQGKLNLQIRGNTFKNCMNTLFVDTIYNATKSKNLIRLDGNTRYSQVVFNVPNNAEFTFFVKVLDNKLNYGTVVSINKTHCTSTTNNEAEVMKNISNGVIGLLHPFSLVGKSSGTDRNVWIEILNPQGGHIDLEIYIFEGRVKYFPDGITEYFEGLDSVGEKEGGIITLKTFEKNIFDWEKTKEKSSSKNSFANNVITFKQNGDYVFLEIVGGFKEKTKYTISGRSLEGKGHFQVNYTDGTNSQWYAYLNNPLTTEGEKTIKNIHSAFTDSSLNRITDLQIVKGSTYNGKEEGVKTTKIVLPKDINGLNGIGNISDRILEKDGSVYIEKRLKKMVANGNENWGINEGASRGNLLVAYLFIPDKTKEMRSELACDRFEIMHSYPQVVNNQGIWSEGGRNSIVLSIDKGLLSSPDIHGLKKWLSENPTTILYQLDVPDVIKIKTFSLEASSKTSIRIENSILPRIIYEVQLNRGAQVENLTDSILSLRQRVNELERWYDDCLLENQYRINLIRLEEGDEI